MLAGVLLQQRGRRGARAAAPGLSATMGLFTVQLAAAALARARLASTRSSRARLRPALFTRRLASKRWRRRRRLAVQASAFMPLAVQSGSC